MENFFIEENFFMDLDSLISHLDLDDDGAVEALEEDWSIKAEHSELEPVVKLTLRNLVDYLFDSNEERFTEDGDECDDIEKALKASIDFEKLNVLLPKLYYPTGKFEYITKQDLLDYIK